MRFRFVLTALLALPAAAQESEPYHSSPEQYPGQLARLRLSALYPTFVPEPAHPPADDPASRLDGFLKNSAPVLKNARGLIDYIHEGLRDPRAIGQPPTQWREAWALLDGEAGNLARLAQDGEVILREGVSARPRGLGAKESCPSPPPKPEFDSAEGARLHGALVHCAYVCRLRALIVTKSAQAAGAKRLDERAREEAAALAGLRPDAAARK